VPSISAGATHYWRAELCDAGLIEKRRVTK
jgi:hypothetical protein